MLIGKVVSAKRTSVHTELTVEVLNEDGSRAALPDGLGNPISLAVAHDLDKETVRARVRQELDQIERAMQALAQEETASDLVGLDI
jgi:acyl-CoA hydrolase